MPLAIELDDGSIIADGDWHRMDDVMRASHGHGVNRMPGKLIEVNENLQKLRDAVIETTGKMEEFAEAMRIAEIEDRCDYSDLFPSQCAHCQGHVADWEITPKVEVYD
jgi:hypothetical protein